jgi:mRNA interferase MazF
LVIQASETLPYRDSVTVCLLTTDLIDAPLFRVRIEPAAGNALARASDVMADKVLTVPREVLSAKPFGRLGAADLDRVDAALRFWLGL